jgi:glycyl-tRNA synthetase beta chain
VAELLLEIGFEEMPAPWLAPLAVDLAARFAEEGTREHLAVSGARAYQTPRRLVLRADLADRQPDREERVFGPALKVAKDATGNWTKAAEGFARKAGVRLDQLGFEAKAEGGSGPPEADLYLVFSKKTAGRLTSEVLPDLLARVLRALSFPKRMSWDAWLDDGRGSFPFGRPIRWMIVLLDGEIVPFAIYALAEGAKGPVIVESGRTTRGHRFLPRGRGGQPIEVRSFGELTQRLRDGFVLVDPAERKSRIDAGLSQVSPASALLPDPYGLREEWRDLVEYPTVVAGHVPSEFHSLPREVLETVLVHHQKYVPLADAAGRVTRFAAVINGDGAAASDIVRGMERVVVARLRDAAFFYDEDLKRPLAKRFEDLAGVTFHQGLGTYQDKAARLVRLVEAMGRSGLLDRDQLEAAVEAARLAKCDLTTLMVREFPELQGIVGGIYLRAQGAAEAVASAVGRHYEPAATDPRHLRVTAAVSLADKLDTLAGYFGLGESPTGSRDPYGLRRAGQGAVRAVVDHWSPKAEERVPDLEALAAVAVEGYGRLKQPAEKTTAVVSMFLLDRLEYVLETRGFSHDEVAAVVYAPDPAERSPAFGSAPRRIRALADPIDALRRVEALQRVRREVPEDFAALAEAFKRAKNILTQAPPSPSVDTTLFEAEAERALFEAVSRLENTAGSYDERLRGLARLRAPVSRFFDDVLVMAKEPHVRGNRLALLNSTLSLFYHIADISKLGG